MELATTPCRPSNERALSPVEYHGRIFLGLLVPRLQRHAVALWHVAVTVLTMRSVAGWPRVDWLCVLGDTSPVLLLPVLLPMPLSFPLSEQGTYATYGTCRQESRRIHARRAVDVLSRADHRSRSLACRAVLSRTIHSEVAALYWTPCNGCPVRHQTAGWDDGPTRVTPSAQKHTLSTQEQGGHDVHPPAGATREARHAKGADPSMNTPPTPPTAAVTVPVAILKALSRALIGWTATVYPGRSVHLETASRDPAARRPHTWHATALLSNGVRLHFTLVVHDDGIACVTRHARLADLAGEAGGDADKHRPAPAKRF